MRFSLLAVLLGTIATITVQVQSATIKNRVYLIRHGEKPPTGNGLSTLGLERSQCLPNIFTSANGYNMGLIMAQQPQSNGHQQRPYDTVEPLASSLNLTIDAHCQRDDIDCVADQIKSFAEGSEKDILICWEHKRLKQISEVLGDKFKYPGGRFGMFPSWRASVCIRED